MSIRPRVDSGIFLGAGLLGALACNASGVLIGGQCLYIDNISVELPPPAPGWTCEWYDDGICQCGCGAPDPDCPNATIADCQICEDVGSCNIDQCPGTIDPNDTTTCQ